jgi:hypothetical protein
MKEPVESALAEPASPVVLQPQPGMRVPVHMFVSPEIMPGQDALDELTCWRAPRV